MNVARCLLGGDLKEVCSRRRGFGVHASRSVVPPDASCELVLTQFPGKVCSILAQLVRIRSSNPSLLFHTVQFSGYFRDGG